MNSIGISELVVIGILLVIFADPRKAGEYIARFKRWRVRYLSWQVKMDDKLREEAEKIVQEQPELHSDIQDTLDAKALRKQVKTKFKELSRQQIEEYSSSLVHAVLQQDFYKKASHFCAFVAIPGEEPQLMQLIQQAFDDGKQVYLPRITDRSGSMEMVKIQSLKEDLIKGAFGILEPREDLPSTDLLNPPSEAGDLTIFVPGLVFGANGERIGRGKGFYDRFLAQHKNALKVGLCFGVQFFSQERIPQSDHDIPMDYVVTESHLFKTGSTA